MDIKSRAKAITRTSVVGILANIVLVIFKAIVGMIAGSISIVLDAVNNLTDALSSIITIAGIKIAKKKPDEKHPYGYGRVEYFSTMLISIMVLFAGGTSAIESVKKIIDPTVPNYSMVTIIVVVASVFMKLVLGKYVKTQGEKLNSNALVASGADASFDAIISASTLLGAVVVYFFNVSIDGYIGAVISIFIIKAGFEMLLEAVGDVMGARPDGEITKDIKATIKEIEPVMGAYDLTLHNYGPEAAIGSVHVEIPAEMSAAELHRLTLKIQRTILEKFHIFLSVGIYAIDTKDEQKIEMRRKIAEICTAHEGVINAHGIYINDDEKVITFDSMIDFTIKDKGSFNKLLVEEVSKAYPGYDITISFDTNYCD